MSWKFTNFALEVYQMCGLFADIKKFSIGLESQFFSDLFLQNIDDANIEQRHHHGKLRNGHGQFTEKVFAKFVGTPGT